MNVTLRNTWARARGTWTWLCLGVVLAASACGKDLDNLGGDPKTGVKVPATASLANVADHDPEVPSTAAGVAAANPTSPADDSGKGLGWTSAALMSGLQVTADRDSVVITVPAVSGAADYRVFALPAGVSVQSQGGGEAVTGTDVYCAGNHQYNAPAPATPVVMQQIEVFNVQGATRLVVEAIDRNCPFAGLRGSASYTTHAGNSEVPASDRVDVSVYTDEQQRQAYGAVIFNGHAHGTLAAPAPNSAPAVLARTTLQITPRGNNGPELAYFDDFSTAMQPQFVQTFKTFGDRNSNAQLLQNGRWNFYQTNYDHTDLLIDRGQLQTLLMDRYQDVFSTNYMVPRRAVQLGDNDYLHVTYTVASDSTQRRYWWLFLCGAASAGQTIDDNGNIKGNIVQTSFFYQPDGRNPSVEGWNCFQMFPRDGTPFGLPPDNTRPQSDVRVMVNNPTSGTSVVDVSPDQYRSVGDAGVASSVYGGWYRQQDAKGTLVAPILDDLINIAPRARYDVYLSRTRVIVLVNGKQRICNDFPSNRLSMAEGALGFGQVLYHTTAERGEFSDSFNVRTGQTYYLTNTPYADVRSWDNVGYQEHTRAPSAFDASLCYVYKP